MGGEQSEKAGTEDDFVWRNFKVRMEVFTLILFSLIVLVCNIMSDVCFQTEGTGTATTNELLYNVTILVLVHAQFCILYLPVDNTYNELGVIIYVSRDFQTVRQCQYNPWHIRTWTSFDVNLK